MERRDFRDFSIHHPDIFSVYPPRDLSPRSLRETSIQITEFDQKTREWGYTPENLESRFDESKLGVINWDKFNEILTEVTKIRPLQKGQEIIPEHIPAFREMLTNFKNKDQRQAAISFAAFIASLFPYLPILSSLAIELGVNVPNTTEAVTKWLRTHNREDRDRAIRYLAATVGEGVLSFGVAATIIKIFGLQFGTLFASSAITGTVGTAATGFFTNTFWQSLGDQMNAHKVNNRNLKRIQYYLYSDNSPEVKNQVETSIRNHPQKDKILENLNNYLIETTDSNGRKMYTSVRLQRLSKLYQRIKPSNEEFILYYLWQLGLEEAQVESAARLKDILESI